MTTAAETRYTLGDEIFRSGRTIVRRAVDADTDASVVLKVLRDAGSAPTTQQAFQREYGVLRRLHGVDGVIQALALERFDERWAIVLEDVGGQSLASVIETRPLRTADFLVIATELASTLARVHAAEVVHRDINAANIVINRGSGKIRIIDFGIATRLPRSATRFQPTSAMVGTLTHISPEQTGRMNRRVDHRTDLYSLGVTFYQMLCGTLPFTETAPLALVHAHIARAPVPLTDRSPQVPEALSAIVSKLMAKAPEDRYQSAASLAADLKECRRQDRELGRIRVFPLDQQHVPSRLELPGTLYGRAQETAALHAAFERVSKGHTELLLVSGYSGVGKSALVQQLYRPITQRGGFFVSGKFDLLQRDVPYAVIVQALGELCRQVLGETQARLDSWKEALLDALGPNGQVLLDLLPEFELVIGPQPPAPELSSAEQRNRLQHTITSLFRVFAQAAHPLTVFLDDLQWVDPAAMELIEALLVGGEVDHLLVIGAYRDNEVEAGHPLLVAVDRVRGQGRVPVTHIEVPSLGQDHVTALITDMTRRDPEDAAVLAELVVKKTDGNPFFVREFVQTLYQEGAVSLSEGRWTWDLRAIRALQITENVVELVAQRIRHLDSDAQSVLQRAGMLGSRFDLDTLSVVTGRPARALWDALWPSIQDGFLIVTSDSEGLGAELDQMVDAAAIKLRFSHDRVQQATSVLVDPAERQRISWEIGQRMAARWPPTDGEPRLFDIVGHLNLGRIQCTNQQQRDELAALNLLAVRRARASAAFASSYGHAQLALDLLGSGAHERHYALVMNLLSECVEAAYQTGAYEQMDAWFAKGTAISQAVVDTAWMQEIKTEAFNAQGRPLDAIAHALDYLDALGVVVPREPDEQAVGAALGRAAASLGERSISELEHAPDVQDPSIRAAIRLICKIYSSAYVANPYLFIVVCLRQVELVLEHGNSEVSPLPYAVYGLLLAGLAGDLDGGYAFGALSNRMLERPDTKRFEAQARHLFSCHTRMWKEPLKACADGERVAFRVGLETGEHEYGCYGAHVASKYAFFHGQQLHTLRPEVEQYTAAMSRYRQDIAGNSHLPWHQAIVNLTEATPTPHRLQGPVLDASEARPRLDAVNDRMSISNALTAELVLGVIFCRFDDAVERGTEGAGFLDAVLSQFNQPLHIFFDAFARLERLHEVDSGERAPLRSAAAAGLETLAGWAVSVPENLSHMVRLLEALMLDLDGQDHPARDAFDEAIQLASRSGFTMIEALANESASRFHGRRGRSTPARHYVLDARAVYARWGATTKVLRLEAEHASLMPTERGRTVLPTITTTTATGMLATGALDVASLVRAAETIATEVVLPRLLRSMLQVLAENAGAGRAVLVLVEEGVARVQAELRSDGAVEVLQAAPLGADGEEARWLPISLYNYAIRTGESVVLDNASRSVRFQRDPYIRARGTRSALCVPFNSQGRLTGAVYLENDQAAGAFTEDRASLVTLLAGQMAISVDNARLYENLERRVASRTQQLEARNSFIREVFGRYMSDEVVDTLLDSREALKLGGERRPMTIMFTDLRGFTAMCERLPPEAVIRTINTYFAAMTDVVHRHEGSINNIMGDGLMVLFGAPLWRDDHAERAVACALDMQLAIAEVNRLNAAEGLPVVSMGIGVHTGEAVVGNIGSEKRAKFSVIGRDVNLAARLESGTAGGEILITGQTLAATTRAVIVGETRRIHPKGIDEPLDVHLAIGLEGRPELNLN